MALVPRPQLEPCSALLVLLRSNPTKVRVPNSPKLPIEELPHQHAIGSQVDKAIHGMFKDATVRLRSFAFIPSANAWHVKFSVKPAKTFQLPEGITEYDHFLREFEVDYGYIVDIHLRWTQTSKKSTIWYLMDNRPKVAGDLNSTPAARMFCKLYKHVPLHDAVMASARRDKLPQATQSELEKALHLMYPSSRLLTTGSKVCVECLETTCKH